MFCLQGAVYHVVTTPVAVGSEVEVEVDWGRRYDHMQQHTGGWLISLAPTLAAETANSTCVQQQNAGSVTMPMAGQQGSLSSSRMRTCMTPLAKNA